MIRLRDLEKALGTYTHCPERKISYSGRANNVGSPVRLELTLAASFGDFKVGSDGTVMTANTARPGQAIPGPPHPFLAALATAGDKAVTAKTDTGY